MKARKHPSNFTNSILSESYQNQVLTINNQSNNDCTDFEATYNKISDKESSSKVKGKRKKDWTGNKQSVYTTMGARNYAKSPREKHDYYASDPKAVRLLCEREQFDQWIWEPAAGGGHLSKVLSEELHYNVLSSDLINRGIGISELDFLHYEGQWNGSIITNPPYSAGLSFVRQALKVVQDGAKVAMLLKLTFLEGIERAKFFENHPPVRVYVFSKRIRCAKGGDFETLSNGKNVQGAMTFAWFLWVKGSDKNAKPQIHWIRETK